VSVRKSHNNNEDGEGIDGTRNLSKKRKKSSGGQPEKNSDPRYQGDYARSRKKRIDKPQKREGIFLVDLLRLEEKKKGAQNRTLKKKGGAIDCTLEKKEEKEPKKP